MKIIRSRFAVGMMLLLAFAMVMPVFCQDNSLEVKCVGPDGQALAGVKVIAAPITSPKMKDAKSDKTGVALFKKLDDGVYRVVARQTGFAPTYDEFFAFKGGGKQSVELRFAAGDPTAKLYFEDQAVNQKAYQLLEEGVKLLQAGKFADGEKPIRESLKIYPTNPDSNYNLAIALLQQKKFDDTVPPLKKTIAVASALAQMPMQGQAGGENPYAARQKDAQFLLDKLPGFKLRSEGEKFSQERKFDEAIGKYQEALKMEPNDADLYYNISLAHANAKRYDEAMKSADKAVELKPAEKDYQDLKKKIKEIQDNEVLLKAKAMLEEGDKMYQAEDFNGALKKYEEALPLVPKKNQPTILAQIGRTYGKLKQSDKAVDSFKKAIEMAPDVPDLQKALAQFYLTEKRYEEALNVYADPRAAGSVPPDQALFNLGQALSKQGNSEVAELAWEKALKVNPNHVDAAYEYGMSLYFSKKNDKLAKEVLNRYLQLGKDAARLDNVKSVLVVMSKRSQ